MRALLGGIVAAVVTAAGAAGAAGATPVAAPLHTASGAAPEIRSDTPLRGDTAKPVLGLHRVTVVPVYWSTPGTATAADIDTTITAVDRNYSTWTGGKIHMMAGQVKPWTQISLTSTQISTCDLGAIERAARAAVGTDVTLESSSTGALGFAYRLMFPEKTQALLWSGTLTGLAAHVRPDESPS